MCAAIYLSIDIFNSLNLKSILLLLHILGKIRVTLALELKAY